MLISQKKTILESTHLFVFSSQTWERHHCERNTPYVMREQSSSSKIPISCLPDIRTNKGFAPTMVLFTSMLYICSTAYAYIFPYALQSRNSWKFENSQPYFVSLWHEFSRCLLYVYPYTNFLDAIYIKFYM